MGTENYKDKIVLVTGGAQGIGLGIALAFGQTGAQVVVADADDEAGKEAMERLQNEQVQAMYIPCDVNEETQVADLMEKVKQRHGRLDVLINNAGIADPFLGKLDELQMTEFDRVLAVNLRGPMLCSKYALPLLRKATHPAILNITSTRAFMSEPDTFAYSASKGGLEALTHALAVSLAPDRIRINAIAPGWIETGPWQKKKERYEPRHTHSDKAQHPVGRVGEPRDVAEAALFLCSERAGFVTGQHLVVDGGMTVKMIYT